MEAAQQRTSAKQKAKQLVKYLKKEQADYLYLKAIFKHLRHELNVKVSTKPKKLPYVPTEEEMRRYYEAVWQARNMQHMLIIKTLLYTGVRVSELVHIKLIDVDFDRCQIRINKGKGSKDRMVPFPSAFKEVLAMHVATTKKKEATYLFESSWKKPYSDRGIRKILNHYTTAANLSRSVSPHKLRHFLFTWLKKQGIEDALIQPYSGHSSRQSLEVYSLLSLSTVQEKYEEVMNHFPI